MIEKQNRQDQDKVIIRMPDGMRDEIQAEAKKNKRSANAEIVARLSQTGIGGGETLRDRFAMAALTGYLADPTMRASGMSDRRVEQFFEELAENSYEIADAFMAERQKAGAA